MIVPGSTAVLTPAVQDLKAGPAGRLAQTSDRRPLLAVRAEPDQVRRGAPHPVAILKEFPARLFAPPRLDGGDGVGVGVDTRAAVRQQPRRNHAR